MSFPFTNRLIPTWKAKEIGLYKLFIKLLICLASFAASLTVFLHLSKASGNSFKPSPKT